MYRILICDDDEATLCKISSIAESVFFDQRVKLHAFTQADQISDQILGSCDIALLDVDLQDNNCTGMDLAVVRLFDVYHNPERFMFYFGEKYIDCPVMINTVGRTDNPAKVFMAASRAVRAYKNEKWNALYTFAADLLEFVSIKAELLNRLQPAYAAGDRAYIEKAANALVPKATALLKSLRLQVQTRWLSIQKPYGFGALNAYYGAGIAEMEYTEARLSAYISGKISALDELEQENLGFKYADPMKNNFRLI